MHVLGLSIGRDGAAAALVREGRPLALNMEERWTRRRADPSLPLRAARACLARVGAGRERPDYIVLAEKPVATFQRLLMNQMAAFPRGVGAFGRSMSRWLGDALWIKGRLADEFDLPGDRVLFADGHRALAAGAWATSPWSEAAILVLDRGAENDGASIFRGRDARIERLASLEGWQSLPTSRMVLADHLGLLMEGSDDDGRVGDLAAYGACHDGALDAALCRDSADGVSLAREAFDAWFDPEAGATARLQRLLGPAPRLPVGAVPSGPVADGAAAVEAFSARALLRLAQETRRRTECSRMCLAGPLATDATLLGHLAESGLFESIHVAPVADGGLAALGAALHGGQASEQGALLPAGGADWSVSLLGETLRGDVTQGPLALAGDEAVVEQLAARLVAGGCMAWLHGHAEPGPQARGRRCLLADPRSAAQRDALQADPVSFPAWRTAPLAFAEQAVPALFDVPPSARPAIANGPVAVRARPGVAQALGAGVHVDGRARVWSVGAGDHPLLHRVLTRVGERTGYAAALQTDLRRPGEPLMASVDDAVRLFEQSRWDGMIIEDRAWMREGRPPATA